MKLRPTRPGDYFGLALYGREGVWRIGVSEFRGRDELGVRWRTVSGRAFFRLDVLQRQVAAAGLPFEVESSRGVCVFRPTGGGRTRPQGVAIVRFMKKHYPVFGQDRKVVSWSWDVVQYD